MNQLTRRLTIALVVSIGINLFLVGFITARFIFDTGNSESIRDFERGPIGLYGATQALGNPRPMKQLLSKHLHNFRPNRNALREARRKVANALAAEPFKPDVLKAALNEVRQTTQASQAVMHKALIELAESLTPQERKKLSMSRHLWRGGKGPQAGRRMNRSIDK